MERGAGPKASPSVWRRPSPSYLDCREQLVKPAATVWSCAGFVYPALVG